MGFLHFIWQLHLYSSAQRGLLLLSITWYYKPSPVFRASQLVRPGVFQSPLPTLSLEETTPFHTLLTDLVPASQVARQLWLFAVTTQFSVGSAGKCSHTPEGIRFIVRVRRC